MTHSWNHQLLSKHYFPIPGLEVSEELHNLHLVKDKDITKIATLFWSTWKTWHRAILDNDIFSPLQTLIVAKRSRTEWKTRLKFSLHDQQSSQLSPHSSASSSIHFIKWHPPLLESIKINFDGFKTNQGAAVRFIIRDEGVCCSKPGPDQSELGWIWNKG